jgi:hypothetical protein
MAKAGYNVMTQASVALVASTAKTVLAATSPATHGLDLKKLRIAFDSVTYSAAPVLLEIITGDLGAAGTSTACTVRQVYGRSILSTSFTAAYGYTVEPTTLTVVDTTLITPVGGTFWYDYPLGDTPDIGVSSLIGLRLTAPAGVNCRAAMALERC